MAEQFNEKPAIDAAVVNDIAILNRAASDKNSRFCRKSFSGKLLRREIIYKLKNHLCTTHGYFDGYDLQFFTTTRWYWNNYSNCWCEGEDENCAECTYDTRHWHILKRWNLGGSIFHQPTDEFKFESDAVPYHHRKQSPRFEEFLACVKGQIEGRKCVELTPEENALAWAAFKRLVKAYSHIFPAKERRNEARRKRLLDRFWRTYGDAPAYVRAEKRAQEALTVGVVIPN